MLEEELAVLLREVCEPEDVRTVEARTLHDPVTLQFVRRDDGATLRAGVRDDAHG